MSLDPINLYDYEARAKLTLPHNNWEFIEAGAMDEFTTRRNRSAFEDLTLRPRFLRDISERGHIHHRAWHRDQYARHGRPRRQPHDGPPRG